MTSVSLASSSSQEVPPEIGALLPQPAPAPGKRAAADEATVFSHAVLVAFQRQQSQDSRPDQARSSPPSDVKDHRPTETSSALGAAGQRAVNSPTQAGPGATASATTAVDGTAASAITTEWLAADAAAMNAAATEPSASDIESTVLEMVESDSSPTAELHPATDEVAADSVPANSRVDSTTEPDTTDQVDAIDAVSKTSAKGTIARIPSNTPSTTTDGGESPASDHSQDSPTDLHGSNESVDTAGDIAAAMATRRGDSAAAPVEAKLGAMRTPFTAAPDPPPIQKTQSGQYQVKLESPEMGKVWLYVKDARQGIEARIVTSQEATHQLLASEWDNVRSELRQSGIHLTNFSLQDRGEQGGRQGSTHESNDEPQRISEPQRDTPEQSGQTDTRRHGHVDVWV